MKNPREDKRFGVQYAYILEHINPENYGVSPESDKELMQFLIDTFDKEHNDAYYRKLFPKLQDRIEDWFRGLPSSFNIDYSNYSIAQIGIQWGFEESVDKGTFVDRWWSTMALRVIQLADKLGVDTKHLH